MLKPTLKIILRADSLVTFPNHSRNTERSLRIVGVDDGSFHANRKIAQSALLVAVLFHDLQITKIELGWVLVDGTDANRVLLSLLRRMRFDVVMLSGISFAGFNVVDIEGLSARVRRPVMAITGDKPDNEAVRNALRGHFTDWKNRWRIVRAAGRTHRFSPRAHEPPLYFEVHGASPALAKHYIEAAAKISRLPEPIRVAGIVARGLSDVVQLTGP